MNSSDVKPGQTIVLNQQQRLDFFRGAEMVVDEVVVWGVKGYVPGREGEGRAYYRAAWDQIEKVKS